MSDISKLLEETPEAYYWIGFLMADGCFSKYKSTKIDAPSAISLKLADKDYEHLCKYAEFVGHSSLCSGHNKNGSVWHQSRVGSNIYVPLLCKKFDIHERKTYNPPSPDFIPRNDDLFLCWLVGYIDGDGCINLKHGKAQVRVTAHSKWYDYWLHVTKKLSTIVGESVPIPIINKCFDKINIQTTRHSVLCLLRRTITRFNLPALERKWKHVDVSHTLHARYNSTRSVSLEKCKKAIDMINSGMDRKEAVKLLGLSERYFYKLKKELEYV